MKTVSILGTDYEIIVKKYDSEPAFKKRDICGYCDVILKQIVYCEKVTHKGWEEESKESCRSQEQLTIRHEIVHAFLDESGLSCNTLANDDSGWARNEEMVDWFAIQGPRIYAAWKKAEAI